MPGFGPVASFPVASIGNSDASGNLSGIAATAQAGTLTAVIGSFVFLTGIDATGQVGDFSTHIDPGVLVIGAFGTAQTGAFSFQISSALPLAGVAAIGNLGVFAVVINAFAFMDGVAATALVQDVGLDITITGVLPVYSIMRNSPVPSSALMQNETVACEGNF